MLTTCQASPSWGEKSSRPARQNQRLFRIVPATHHRAHDGSRTIVHKPRSEGRRVCLIAPDGDGEKIPAVPPDLPKVGRVKLDGGRPRACHPRRGIALLRQSLSPRTHQGPELREDRCDWPGDGDTARSLARGLGRSRRQRDTAIPSSALKTGTPAAPKRYGLAGVAACSP